METQIDYAHVRGILAARRIPHKHLAQMAGLSQHYTSKILCGQRCGELARLKLARGLERLGLDREMQHAS